MRGLKRRNFWVMESTAGCPGWGVFRRNPRPGEIRKVAYQQVARGCDGHLWFRWRTCTAGREQYWHGLLGHDGKPLRRYREAAEAAGEFHRLARYLAGTTVKARVAMVYDYDSLWALRIQPGFEGNDYQAAMRRYYDALFRAGVNVDMVRPMADLRRYRAVIAPALHVLPDAVADALAGYVRRGGVLLTDCRTGVKDETNLCHERTLPGRLSEVLGIVIEEYGALTEDTPVVGAGLIEGQITAGMYADWLKPRGAEVLARYIPWYLSRFAAATRHACGEGTAYYVGTVIREEAFYDRLIAEVLRAAHVRPVLQPPPGVEASVRQGGAKGERLLFLINHTEQKQTVRVPPGKRELITGEKTADQLKLGVYGVAVIRL